MSEQLWQGYDEQGLPTGPVTLPQCADGALHGAAHIWIWRRQNDNVDILLQLRAADVPTWPSFLDVSAAGHIDFGETPMQAALRESEEEIGLALRPQDLSLLFVGRNIHTFVGPPQIIENEFRWVYAHELVDESQLRLDDGEVEAVRWVTLKELKQLAADPGSKLVPQGEDYFMMLFAGIERLAKEA